MGLEFACRPSARRAAASEPFPHRASARRSTVGLRHASPRGFPKPLRLPSPSQTLPASGGHPPGGCTPHGRTPTSPSFPRRRTARRSAASDAFACRPSARRSTVGLRNASPRGFPKPLRLPSCSQTLPASGGHASGGCTPHGRTPTSPSFPRRGPARRFAASDAFACRPSARRSTVGLRHASPRGFPKPLRLPSCSQTLPASGGHPSGGCTPHGRTPTSPSFPRRRTARRSTVGLRHASPRGFPKPLRLPSCSQTLPASGGHASGGCTPHGRTPTSPSFPRRGPARRFAASDAFACRPSARRSTVGLRHASPRGFPKPLRLPSRSQTLPASGGHPSGGCTPSIRSFPRRRTARRSTVGPRHASPRGFPKPLRLPSCSQTLPASGGHPSGGHPSGGHPSGGHASGGHLPGGHLPTPNVRPWRS